MAVKPVIKLNKATKLYGQTVGVKNVTLDVNAGTIFGFLGPNGAGKTTTISMLVDLIRPTKGSIQIFGLDSINDSLDIRKRIGFLAGDFALDGGLTGWQQLEYFGSLRGNLDKSYVHELALRLNCNLNRKFKTLSRGNRQKVGLISALMHKPELLIFDEPTSGLDPLVQEEFHKIIREHKNSGGTAFISSHLLSEVQEICDMVGFVREGSLIAVKNMADISTLAPRRVRLVCDDPGLKQKIKKLKGVDNAIETESALSFTYGGDVNPLLKLASAYKLKDLTIAEADLESAFMEFYKD